jgi:hypothetical protein
MPSYPDGSQSEAFRTANGAKLFADNDFMSNLITARVNGAFYSSSHPEELRAGNYFELFEAAADVLAHTNTGTAFLTPTIIFEATSRDAEGIPLDPSFDSKKSNTEKYPHIVPVDALLDTIGKGDSPIRITTPLAVESERFEALRKAVGGRRSYLSQRDFDKIRHQDEHLGEATIAANITADPSGPMFVFTDDKNAQEMFANLDIPGSHGITVVNSSGFIYGIAQSGLLESMGFESPPCEYPQLLVFNVKDEKIDGGIEMEPLDAPADRENAQSFAGFFSEVVKTYLGGQQRSEAGSAVQTSERNALIAGQVDIETVRAGGKFIDEILERNAKEAQDAERKGPESTDPEGFLRELIEEGTKEKPSPEEAKKPRTDIVR